MSRFAEIGQLVQGEEHALFSSHKRLYHFWNEVRNLTSTGFLIRTRNNVLFATDGVSLLITLYSQMVTICTSCFNNQNF
jgi:hypothetical protein